MAIEILTNYQKLHTYTKYFSKEILESQKVYIRSYVQDSLCDIPLRLTDIHYIVTHNYSTQITQST